MTSHFDLPLNDYYKLKSKYEDMNRKEKTKILNNKDISWREKRYEYQQIKPKCINCKRPVGSIFSLKYDEELDARLLKAMCGDKVNPCPLNIVINMGYYENYLNSIKEIENIIKKYKDEIISDKNKLLFGYITTEEALSKFDSLKNNISEYTTLLSHELTQYMDIIDNPEEKTKLNMKIQESYDLIAIIKETMNKFDQDNDTQFVKDAVDIYVNSLTPKLKDILTLKYKYCSVELDDDNVYQLIQRKNTTQQLEYALVEPNIISFVTGVEVKRRQTKKNNADKSTKTKTQKIRKNIEIVSSDEENEALEENEAPEVQEQALGQQTIQENPKYNDDGTVTWSNEDYKYIWNGLNEKYKTALLQDHEWLEETIIQYDKDRKAKKTRDFLNPTNLIIPPQILDDGKYDFGNSVYNDIFNNKISKIQKDVLIGMISKTNVSGSSQFIDALGQIVGQYLGFTKY